MAPSNYLFVPGDRPDRFAKAVATGADRVILDLEDAVAPSAKVTARASIAQWLQADGQVSGVLIRVNAVATAWHADDLALMATPGVAGVVLPKAESAAALAGLRAALPPAMELHAIIESVAGLIHVRSLAAVPGLTRLAFGSVDFCNDAGMIDTGQVLDSVRAQIVLESRYAGLPAPIDGVSMAIHDEAALEADVRRSRSFGFGAKFCIHPKQIAAVRRGFLPSDLERRWAEQVLAAAAANPHGAFAVEGKLIDKPMIDQARAIAAIHP